MKKQSLCHCLFKFTIYQLECRLFLHNYTSVVSKMMSMVTRNQEMQSFIKLFKKFKIK